MLLFFTLLSVTVPILSAPQNVIVKEVLKPTVPSSFEEKKVDPLVQVANLPSAPINVTDSAKPCSSCGKGPLLACPKDGGECGSGEACCYDSCRARQVCRPTSEITGFKERNDGRIHKREVVNSSTTTKIDRGLESASSRQNEEIPIPLDEDYESFDENPAFPSQPFALSGSLGTKQDFVPPFGDISSSFSSESSPQEFQQYDSFYDIDEQDPFVLQQGSQPLISFLEPVIIPQESFNQGDENYDDDDDEGGFLDSLFG